MSKTIAQIPEAEGNRKSGTGQHPRPIAVHGELTDEWKTRGCRRAGNIPSSPLKSPGAINPDVIGIIEVKT